MAVISKWVGQRRWQVLSRVSNRIKRRLLFRWLLIGLALVAFLPPLYFHFKLRHFRQMQLRKCHWIRNPPLVCAHGGDSSKAFPNTVLVSNDTEYAQMDAYRSALNSQVDCIEIDVSRSLDGALFALHDRELQQISGNRTSRVGHLSMKEIKELHSTEHIPLFHDVHVPTIEDALKMVMGSVQQVILDTKVGPPLYEKGLAKDMVDIVQKTGCTNCVIWAKSDSLVRDVMKLSPDVMVGYIVMIDFATGSRTKLLRMRGADVVGVYHPLVDEKLMRKVHGRKKKVYAWTVDDETSMQKMLMEQVDAVVTSKPTLFQRVMQDIRTECLEEGFSLSSQE